MMIVGLTDRQWAGIVKAMGIEAQIVQLSERLQLNLNLEGDRFTARKEIAAIVEPWFSEHSSDFIESVFDDNGVCWGPYHTFREMVEEDNDCSEENPLFKLIEQPGIGTYLAPGSPFNFSTQQRQDPVPAPLLGQHTDEVLSEELGLTSAQIGDLHREGIVAGCGN